MERWRVPDAIALELIEFPGKLGKEGKRPRFRFTTRQQRIASYLCLRSTPSSSPQETIRPGCTESRAIEHRPGGSFANTTRNYRDPTSGSNKVIVQCRSDGLGKIP